ncbi:MAG: TIGR01440 family protein [Bacillota bacterium]|nr:TIGR01440 family protein [Bacillota bacterium]
MNSYSQQLKQALDELLPSAGLKLGQILVIGCSTSEVAGVTIGKGGSRAIAEELYAVLEKEAEHQGFFLALQCCEHLNRALVVSRECAEAYGLTEVLVVPHDHAGGALASHAYSRMSPAVCIVENIVAHAGLDIGLTLIGMHLRPVAVPVRLTVKTIGQATVVAAKTRPKLIGGARALYIDSNK